MSSREEILKHLREKHRNSTLPNAWKSRRNFSDLVERFTESLTAVKGEVRRVENLEHALTEVDTLFDELGAKTVVANDEPPLDSEKLTKLRPGLEWFFVGQIDGNLRMFCAQADVGLSSAEAALAETGSIIVRSAPGKSRLATLLPPVHIALVPVTCLTPDIFTWTARFDDKMPANIVLISGPSKSADIEFTLTLGVHGPKRLIVILYGDRLNS